MTVDDLEHESGLRPLGDYADHCRRCRIAADLRERRATCPHESVTEVRLWGGGVILRSCADCGEPRDG